MPLSDSDAKVEDGLSSHLEQLKREIERETRALFQDTHNTGFYINEYTTKVNVLGDKLLQGLRKAAEKQQDQVDAVALDEQGKAA